MNEINYEISPNSQVNVGSPKRYFHRGTPSIGRMSFEDLQRPTTTWSEDISNLY